MSVAEQLKVNPGLLAALEHFKTPDFSRDTIRVFRHKGKSEVFREWLEHEAIGKALEILRSEDLYQLKFRALVSGMKAHGADFMYERIMREPIQERDLK